MAKKKLSWAEELTGRVAPKRPSTYDYFIAQFNPGISEKLPTGFCGKMIAYVERWEQYSWTKIKRSGLVKSSGFGLSFGKGKPSILYFLTPKGEIEASAAVARIEKYKEEVKIWTAEFRVANARRIEENKVKNDH